MNEEEKARSTRLFEDTSPAAESKLFELLRNKTSAEKFAMVDQLNAGVRTMMMSGLKIRYPDVDEEELKLRFAELVLGPERAHVVFAELLKSKLATDE